jgi:hypothetical protein
MIISRILILLGLVSAPCALASEGFALGKQIGASLSPQVLGDPSGLVPLYQGDNVPEATLRADDLESRSKERLKEASRQRELNKSKSEKDQVITPETLLLTSYLDKPDYRFEDTDPLVTLSNEIAKDPMKAIKLQEEEVKEEVVTRAWQEKCLENAKPFELSDTAYLTHVNVVQKKSTFQGVQFELDRGFRSHRAITHENPSIRYAGNKVGGFNLFRNEYLEGRFPEFHTSKTFKLKFMSSHEMKAYLHDKNVYFYDSGYYFNDVFNAPENFQYLKKILKVPVRAADGQVDDAEGWQETTKEDFDLGSQDLGESQDTWISDNLWESLVDQGICHYAGARCVEGPQTRVIAGVGVTRACWAKRKTYACSFNGPNTCGQWRAKGCQQVGSRCVKKVGEWCLSYEQTLECRESVKTGRKTRIKGKKPFCLDGRCHKVSWQPNQDMTEAISKLAVLKQLAKDMDAQTRTIFKGEALGCGSHCLNFTSCCGVAGGWGVSMGLSSCSENEKKLAKMRGEKKCILTGTYCAEKVLGVCVRKKTNYCCFGSKLARVFHEQARSQLGIGFGDAQNPSCQGLSFDQLSGLNFDTLNMSEIFEDLLSQVVVPDPQAMNTKFKKDWSARLPKDSQAAAPDMQKQIEARKSDLQSRGTDLTMNHSHPSRDLNPVEIDPHAPSSSKLVF